MSRIGKKTIPVPAGVKIAVKADSVQVDGPKGSLKAAVKPQVKVTWTESEKAVNVALADGVPADDKQAKAEWGTTRAIIRNMIDGVTKGYEKNLEVVGVGWQAAVQGKKLKLVVGFANPILLDIPTGINVTVDKSFVKVAGSDKQSVGQFAASMRAVRKPEPYNGKGIKYVEEVIRRKQGKQFGA